MITPSLYDLALYFHILLFVFWLGADLGVAVLGAQFRKRETWSLDQRLGFLKVLVMVDMGPRTAWALMIASTVSLVHLGGYADVPVWMRLGAWAISLFWLWLVWSAFKADQTPKAAMLRKIEMALKWVLAATYLGVGIYSLATDTVLIPNWLAAKAVLFGLIFIAAIMIDVRFKPVGPALIKLVKEGSSDATEVPLRAVMDRSRTWVRVTYLLLVIIGLVGTTKIL